MNRNPLPLILSGYETQADPETGNDGSLGNGIPGSLGCGSPPPFLSIGRFGRLRYVSEGSGRGYSTGSGGVSHRFGKGVYFGRLKTSYVIGRKT